MEISRAVDQAAQTNALGYQVPKAPNGAADFGDLVADQIKASNAQQFVAEQAVEDLVLGQTDDVESVVSAMVRADLSFRMLLEIRNKVIDAYQEIMRMQV